jgi:hypothetical protein
MDSARYQSRNVLEGVPTRTGFASKRRHSGQRLCCSVSIHRKANVLAQMNPAGASGATGWIDAVITKPPTKIGCINIILRIKKMHLRILLRQGSEGWLVRTNAIAAAGGMRKKEKMGITRHTPGTSRNLRSKLANAASKSSRRTATKRLAAPSVASKARQNSGDC